MGSNDVRGRIEDVIIRTLRPHCRQGPYAILDYPNYLNPGDSAIWSGTRRTLEMLFGAPPAYAASLRSFSASRCRAATRGGTVFFLGGGNFGSIYEKHHRRRLAAIEALPDRRIVFLPFSTAGFAGGDAGLREETISAVSRHRAMTLFAREERSRAELARHFSGPIGLCPDLAHMLPPPPVATGRGTTRLLRRDRESSFGPAAQVGSEVWDWDDLAGLRSWNRAGKLLLMLAGRHGTARLMDFVAARKIAIAFAPLAAAAAVETDRLHGVILAALCGREVLAIDNSTGKVAAYVRTWAEFLPNVTMHTTGEPSVPTVNNS